MAMFGAAFGYVFGPLVVVLAAVCSKVTYALLERRGIALGKQLVDKLEKRTKLPDPNWVRS